MIDLAVLFMRCTAIAHQQDEDIASSFKYEMTVIPTDLFKNGLMRKSNKADLARELQSELVNLNTDPLHSHKVLYEVDRGWRLHHVHCKKNSHYKVVFEQHCSYEMTKYGLCRVVCDVDSQPSKKNHKHKHRTIKMSAEIPISGSWKDACAQSSEG